MKVIVDFVLTYADIFFAIMLMVIAGFILKAFVKRNAIVIFILCILGGGFFFLYYNATYSSFEKLSSEFINEDTYFQSLRIIQFDEDGLIWRESKEINDEAMINQVFSELSDLKLKKARNSWSFPNGFTLYFKVVNETKHNYFVTSSFSVPVNDEYLREYRITNDLNHLKTLKELVENGDIEWRNTTN